MTKAVTLALCCLASTIPAQAQTPAEMPRSEPPVHFTQALFQRPAKKKKVAKPQSKFVSKVFNKGFFTRLAQEGIASWYGPGFQGARTASGRRFDMYQSMCAHRWLPFGTVIKIVNLKTNASAVCTVWDRGPFVAGRILDMSYAVKRAVLGNAGTGLVAIYLTAGK